MAAEDLGNVLKNLGKKALIISKEMAEKVLKSPGRALETDANVGSAFAPPSRKAALSSILEVINFYHTVIGLYLEKFF